MTQHNFENDNKYHERSVQARKSTLVSVVVNIFLSALQVVVGIFSGSQGLIADGMHSFSDLVADGVVLMALVALAVKEGLFRYMLAAARRLNSSLLIANAWHARSDAASSLVVALGIIGNLAGFAWFDPLAALAVGLLIARMGYRFAVSALHDLMDRAVDEEMQQAIADTLRTTPGVAGLHDLKTRKAGDLVLVDVHLEVAGEMSVAEGHQIARHARERVLAQHPVLNVMVHLDPCEAQGLTKAV